MAEREEVPQEEEGQRTDAAERSRGTRASVGKGDTSAMAGSDVQQPEIAEGPVEGLQPGEPVERGPWRPPVEVDPPEDTAVPRDAAGEPEAVREQKKHGGP
ncbi:hypothetical protein G5C60_17565 [Streptomyces sp. HC44]|uniref:Uncharacterized protein n=1 Tax=Streptomyces scabichelini TaxID=2711217 RepID=A0A6G4V688_9ACTN|nr:hypothetical protein [Streptomyces scabichelini]NGO09354.1 hypothetical protein [Streptomyces scabichelini]